LIRGRNPTTGTLKKQNMRLSSIIDNLEALVEVRPLSTQEIELKNQENTEIANLLCEKELKWYQRSKSQFILERDLNTRYFHSVANDRNQKEHIILLYMMKVPLEVQEHLMSYITNYYKNLFEAPDEGNFSMDETQTNDIPQVSIEENNLLTSQYSKQVVKTAVF
jgi:hypothetical protein